VQMRVFMGLLIASILCASAEAETPLAQTGRGALTAAAIAVLIVNESRDEYYATGHPCACPDDVTRNGRSCGKMSAYTRPGGAHPLCSPADVTAGMIEDYRKSQLKGASQ
jgi:hypothetical protein